MRRTITAAVLVSGLALSSATLAQTSPSPSPQASGDWQLAVNTQISFGGDTLGEFQVENLFGDVNNSKVKAGESFGASIGPSYTFPGGVFQVQATLGFHMAGVFVENGDSSFVRYPVDLTAFMNFGNHRLGVGASHHLSPEFETDFDFGFNEDVSFKDATGFSVQYDYRILDNMLMGLRFVDIEYEYQTPLYFVQGSPVFASEADGSHVAITFGFLW